MDLVPNRWYAVLRAAEVPTGRGVRHRRLGRDLVWWRDDRGVVRAADDRCPHRGAALSGGAVSSGRLQCPYHGFAFGEDGRCTAIPAHPDMPIPERMALRMVPTREAHGFVYAWSGPGAPDRDGPLPFFDFAGHSHSGSAFQTTWPTHYARVIENELDFAHLPFVHHNTIGVGFPKAIEVRAEVTGDHVRCWHTANPSMVLEVAGPNLWRMPLGSSTWNFIAFAPVDDENVELYLRSYQSLATWEPAAWSIGVANRLLNPVVLAQDARVVPTQRPRVPSLTTGDTFVPSDRGIVAYLRWRAAAKREAQVDEDEAAR